MKTPFILFLIGSLLMQAGGQPINVPIQNPLFEPAAPLTGFDPCGKSGPGASGWIFSPGNVLFQPANPNTCGIPMPPNGSTVASVSTSSGISQVLSATPEQLQPHGDGLFNLTFWVANYYPGYPAYAEAKVSYGTQELCNQDIWVTHVFTQVTMMCPSPVHLIYQSEPGGGPGQGKQPLAISFSRPPAGWYLLVAGPVSLTFTPTN